MYKYIYGPVPSRRLGISLGVDLVPIKVCSFNCIYCECGKSTQLTIERKEYNPIEYILNEIRDFLKQNPPPEFITLSGSGEPTLHSKIGYLISTLKMEYPSLKIAVLTNGCLFYLKEVRNELMKADIVLPSLDAATEKAYITIDRPHPQLSLSRLIDGISQFTKEFKLKNNKKQVWLEVFIIEGINSDDENIMKLREACLKIKPDRIQLNTLDRPGTENWVKPASNNTLENVRDKLSLPNIEIISRFKHREEMKAFRKDVEDTILETVSRRPSTIDDLSETLGIPFQEVRKYIDILEYDKKIQAEIYSGNIERGIFYKIR